MALEHILSHNKVVKIFNTYRTELNNRNTSSQKYFSPHLSFQKNLLARPQDFLKVFSGHDGMMVKVMRQSYIV